MHLPAYSLSSESTDALAVGSSAADAGSPRSTAVVAPPAVGQRLTDRKRQAILQAAISEFRANGFEATSMDRIAASAAVSKRTVYNHFPSKDDLFAEILLQMWDSAAAEDDPIYRDGADLAGLRGQLIELMRRKMRMLSDPAFVDLARVAIGETMRSPERARDMVARLGDKEAGVVNWIRAAQADGRLRAADPVFASHQLQGLLKTFAFWPQIALGEATVSAAQADVVIDSAVDMFLAYYSVT